MEDRGYISWSLERDSKWCKVKKKKVQHVLKKGNVGSNVQRAYWTACAREV
jgi:hypothetical protein